MASGGMEVYQIVGAVDDSGWGQVWSEGGRVIVVFLKEGEDLIQRGGALMEELIAQDGGAGLEWVEKIEEMAKKETEMGGGVIAVDTVEKEGRRALYVAGGGKNMKVVVKRGGSEVVVWNGGAPVSGWIEEGDEVVVGTDQFFEKVWSKVGSDNGLEGRVDEARMIMGGRDDLSGMVGVVFSGGVKNQQAGVVVEEIEKLVTQEPRGRVAANKMRDMSRKIKIGFGGRGVKLKSARPTRRKAGAMLGIVFLLMLMVSVFLGVSKKQQLEREKEFGEVLAPIEFSLDEARSLREVNLTRARNLVREAREAINEQEDRFEGGPLEKDWNRVKNEVDELWQVVSGERQVEGKKWLDLEVIKEGIEVASVAVSEEELLVLGRDGVVLVISLKDKSGEVIGGRLAGFSVGSGRDEVLVLGESQVYGVDRETKQVDSLVELEGVEGVDVEGFGSNIYVLSPEDVFKFPGVEEGYGKRRRFLLAGEGVDVSEGVDLEVDGEVWVLLAGGELIRMSQGVVVEFGLKNTLGEWSELAGVEVSEELGKIWIWNKEGRSVEVFDRQTGEYVGKLLWERFGEARDVLIDEVNNRLLVVMESEVWEVELE